MAKVERISLKDKREQAMFLFFFFLATLSLLLTFVADRS